MSLVNFRRASKAVSRKNVAWQILALAWLRFSVVSTVFAQSPSTTTSEFSNDKALRQRIESDDDWEEVFLFLDKQEQADPLNLEVGAIDWNSPPSELQALELPDSLNEALPVPSAELSPEMTGWVRWLVLRNLPPSIEDNKKWGKQKDVFDGLSVEREGFKIETRRRYKKVNHGTWSRYLIQLDDPAANLQIRIANLVQRDPRTFQFDVIVETPLHAFGRLTRYQWDVQLISLSANADLRARMFVRCEVAVEVNPLSVPPSVSFQPKALEAKAELLDFRLRRVSQLHGPLVKSLSNSLREVAEEKLADYDQKLVEKINRQLDKQKDKLNISLQKWVESTIEQYVQPKPSP